MFIILDSDNRPIGWTHDSNLADEMAEHVDGRVDEVPEAVGCYFHYRGYLRVDGTIVVDQINSLQELKCCSVQDAPNNSSAFIASSKAFTGNQAETLLREFKNVHNS